MVFLGETMTTIERSTWQKKGFIELTISSASAMEEKMATRVARIEMDFILDG